jgi:hypothetical protein
LTLRPPESKKGRTCDAFCIDPLPVECSDFDR